MKTIELLMKYIKDNFKTDLKEEDIGSVVVSSYPPNPLNAKLKSQTLYTFQLEGNSTRVCLRLPDETWFKYEETNKSMDFLGDWKDVRNSSWITKEEFGTLLAYYLYHVDDEFKPAPQNNIKKRLPMSPLWGRNK